jgi:hypothetical protein
LKLIGGEQVGIDGSHFKANAGADSVKTEKQLAADLGCLPRGPPAASRLEAAPTVDRHGAPRRDASRAAPAARATNRPRQHGKQRVGWIALAKPSNQRLTQLSRLGFGPQPSLRDVVSQSLGYPDR